jgi:hypothetical protein
VAGELINRSALLGDARHHISPLRIMVAVQDDTNKVNLELVGHAKKPV